MIKSHSVFSPSKLLLEIIHDFLQGNNTHLKKLKSSAAQLIEIEPKCPPKAASSDKDLISIFIQTNKKRATSGRAIF